MARTRCTRLKPSLPSKTNCWIEVRSIQLCNSLVQVRWFPLSFPQRLSCSRRRIRNSEVPHTLEIPLSTHRIMRMGNVKIALAAAIGWLTTGLSSKLWEVRHKNCRASWPCNLHSVPSSTDSPYCPLKFTTRAASRIAATVTPAVRVQATSIPILPTEWSPRTW